MWRLLSVLAFWGMPAFCAEVCDSLRTWSPKWSAEHRSEPKDNLRPQSFELSVKQGGPAFRITVRPFSPQVYRDPPIHAGDGHDPSRGQIVWWCASMDSNHHCADFKSAASAGWATRAKMVGAPRFELGRPHGPTILQTAAAMPYLPDTRTLAEAERL